MPTSGVTSWGLTARDVINTALRDELGVIGLDETADADEAASALMHLNALVKSHGGGAHYETQGTVTIPAASASGTIASNVRDIISARFSGTFERMLVRWQRDEYLAIPNKAAIGDPTCFYVSNQRDNVVMYVWPVPSAQISVKIDYRRIPEIVVGLSDQVDFPEQYLPALVAMLATRCSGRYPGSAGPELVARAQMLWREMEDNERPASYMLGPY